MKEKSIVKNSIYNIIYKVLNVLFPLISTVIISRTLSPSGVGKVSTAQNFVTYFTFLACLGLPNYGTREIAKNEENLSKTFCELFILNFISTMFCIACYYIMISSFPFFGSEKKLYIISGIAIILNIFNVDWFYQGKEEFKYIAIRSTIVKILMLLAVVFFIREKSDYMKYAFIYCLAIAGNYILNVINLNKYNIKLESKNLNLCRHLKPVFVLFASSIAVELYSLLDVTMLSVQCDENIVGYYSNSMKLVKVAISVITAIGGVLLPRLSCYLKNNEKNKLSSLVNSVFWIMLFFAVPSAIGMSVLADDIVFVLFGHEFMGAVMTVEILSALFLVVSFSNLFGIQILIAANEEKNVLICTILGALSNIILNIVLIPIWKQNGAAIASVISETIVTATMFICAKKYFDLKINKIYISAIGIGVIIMGALLFVVKSIIHNPFISLIMSVALGMIVYVGINYILKNPIFAMLKINMKKYNGGAL